MILLKITSNGMVNCFETEIFSSKNVLTKHTVLKKACKHADFISLVFGCIFAKKETITLNLKYLIPRPHVFIVCHDEFSPKKTTVRACTSRCSNKPLIVKVEILK